MICRIYETFVGKNIEEGVELTMSDIDPLC